MFAGVAGVQPGVIDVEGALQALADSARGAAGAVVAFAGLVRADPMADDRVEALEFEAYPEMAKAELERIRVEAGRRFGLTGCSIVHRTGTVSVGAVIVAVVAAAPHRAAAFEAAAWVMDEVKAQVPVWKRAVDGRGEKAWMSSRKT